tara:strand:+ start:1159 stop:1440 length:282 start_codon:yes stop_codon:yes gene_type:complete
MATEKSITNAILKRLNEQNQCKAIKMHGSIYSTRGTPDIFCVKDGHAILLEVKQPGKKATQLQELQMSQWKGAKATVCVVYSVQDALKVVLGR